MKKFFLSLVSVLFVVLATTAQVGIGTTTPNASASLDVSASNKGFLPPRVALTSTTDVSTVATPATGLLVYNTASAGTAPTNVTPGYYYYTGSSWYRITNPGNAAGDMQYWNGSQWVNIPAGASGAQLTLCNGVPQWGPCGAGAVLPTVTTTAASAITATTASSGGNVTADGGAAVTARGIVYATTANPTLANTVVNSGTGTGSFTSNLTGLTASTQYFVRAFATNSAGTAYGNEVTFTTSAPSGGLPVLTTTATFGVGSTNAVAGGNITSAGGTGLTITARGLVYGTSPSPTLANSVLTDGTAGTGTWTGVINGLTPGTLYYVRAYATNQNGTEYGNEFSFTTRSTGFFAAPYTFDSVKTTSGLIDPTPLPVVSNMTFGAFSATGTSANANASFRFSFTNWTLGATNGSDVFTSAIDSLDKYYEVTITPGSGVTYALDSLIFTLQRSSTGVRQCFVRSSVDGFASNLPVSISPANANLSVVATNKVQITDATTAASPGIFYTLGGGFGSLSGPVTFRFYGVNAESTGGTFSIDNTVFFGRRLP